MLERLESIRVVVKTIRLDEMILLDLRLDINDS